MLAPDRRAVAGAVPLLTASGPAPRLLHVFPTFAVGGAQVRLAKIANHFGGSFRHILFAMDGKYECRQRLDPSLDTAILDLPIRKGHFGNLAAIRRALRDTGPDLLVTHNWGSIEWAMANWPGLVRHIHIEDGFGPDEAHGQLARRIWTRRLVLRRSIVVVPSENLFDIAISLWRLNPRRVRYIPNGIDIAKFAAGDRDQTAANPVPVIGVVAALRAEKNLPRLFEAFRIVSGDTPCRLIVVGDGPERPRLDRLAAELGIGGLVSFAGQVADPTSLYRRFDIFALSSDTEQMPYTVIEAMAAGLPVAATDVGDIGRMVAPENAPFVVPPTAEALAAALRGLARDRAGRATIGTANRSRAVRRFDQSRMFAAYEELFRGTASVPSRP